MADIKWIKLYTNLPDNKKIKRIRKMPDGNNIILFWVFLLLRSGESNQQGGLFFTENVPYDEEDLAADFDFSVEFVRFGLITLEKYKMIELYDDIIFIKNWEEYQSVDSMEKIREQTRLRVSRHREKQRLITMGNVCSYCGEPATGVDHIIASSRGGKDQDFNKTACCIRCNRIKNDKPLVDFLNSNRNIIKDDMIANNDKLNKLVTLCNVTDRYEVTQGNATDIELDKELDIDKDNDSESDKEKIPYKEIIDYLNEQADRQFKPVEKHKTLIKARWNEGQRLDDFKKVVDIKVKHAKDSTNFFDGKYLQPSTLFGNKFDEYLNQNFAEQSVKKTSTSGTSIPYLDEKGVYE